MARRTFFSSVGTTSMSGVPRDTVPPIGDLQYFESAVSAFVPNTSAQILCTHMRDHAHARSHFFFALQRNSQIECPFMPACPWEQRCPFAITLFYNPEVSRWTPPRNF